MFAMEHEACLDWTKMESCHPALEALAAIFGSRESTGCALRATAVRLLTDRKNIHRTASGTNLENRGFQIIWGGLGFVSPQREERNECE